ncbi:MAG: hypothetical protein Q9207_007406 [Kuettlingeria erythrocarpa]
MVRQTRAQKRKQDEEEAREKERQDEPVNQVGDDPPKKRVRFDQSNQEKRPGKGQNPGNPPIEQGDQRVDDTRARKTISQWQGMALPRFETPYWRIRKGVPTVFLHLHVQTEDIDDADNDDDDQDDFEDIVPDSESNHSTTDDNGRHGQADTGENPPPSPTQLQQYATEHPTHPSTEPHTEKPSTAPTKLSEEPPIHPSIELPINSSVDPALESLPETPTTSATAPLQPNVNKHPSQGGTRRRLTPPRASQQSDWGQTSQDPIAIDSQAKDLPLKHYPKFFDNTLVYDVKDPILRVEGDASREDIKRYGKRLAKFIRSPADEDESPDEIWYGIRPLGRGGCGMAGLWEKRNANGETLEQIVIKQIGSGNGELWDPSMLNEAEAMGRLTDLDDGNPKSTVDFLWYKRYPRRQIHRIYMEYCPYGDLHGLIRRFRAKKEFPPIAFIWDVFYHLALASLSLQKVAASEPKGLQVGVHRDIKPQNVFLGQPGPWDEGYMEMYPTTKLGDFGLVIYTGRTDKGNPRNYKGEGTPGYMALVSLILSNPPKRKQRLTFYSLAPTRNKSTSITRAPNMHYVARESKRGAHPRILAYTDTFAIGEVIFELMTLKQARYYLYSHPDGVDPASAREGINVDPSLHVNQAMANRYAPTLIDLMRRCLRPNPDERPSVQELVDITRAERHQQHEYHKDLPDDQLPTTAIFFGGVDDKDDNAVHELSWVASPGHNNNYYDEGNSFMPTEKAVKEERTSTSSSRGGGTHSQDLRDGDKGSPENSKDEDTDSDDGLMVW